MEERSTVATRSPVRRRRTVIANNSRKPAAGKSKAPPPAPLLKGQIWKVKETYVQIVDAGKTLIHYTMSPKPRQRGLRVHMATRETVQDFLKSNEAKLVPE